jgi:hypothetical protein
MRQTHVPTWSVGQEVTRVCDVVDKNALIKRRPSLRMAKGQKFITAAARMSWVIYRNNRVTTRKSAKYEITQDTYLV